MATTFINLYKSLEEAMTTYESPLSTHFDFTGVQLLPDHPYPYRQRTNNPTGIELEDWNVSVYTVCGRLLGSVTEYFFVDEIFNDDNGQPQIVWSLNGFPDIFGYGLVYLQIQQQAGETFWTNPFEMSSERSEFVSRFDYGKKEDEIQSIGFQTWFRQRASNIEITSYYPISTGNTVTSNVKNAKYQKWQTGFISNNLNDKFVDMLLSKYLYCNLEKCNLFDAPEIPDLEFRENFAQFLYNLSFQGVVYDPNKKVPVPEPSENVNVLLQTILIGAKKFMYLSFPIRENNATVGFNFSSLTANGSSVTFNESFAVGTGNGFIAIQTNVLPNIFGNIEVTDFYVRLSDSQGTYNYSFSGNVYFTPSEQQNGISKQITANIT